MPGDDAMRVVMGALLDAPPWLWSSVVQLMAANETAYLEHCRTHAFGQQLAAA